MGTDQIYSVDTDQGLSTVWSYIYAKLTAVIKKVTAFC